MLKSFKLLISITLLSSMSLSWCNNSQCKLIDNDSHGTRGATKVEAIPVVQGLVTPWGMRFINDKEALVTERKGSVLLVNVITGDKTNVPLNIISNDRLRELSEGGLLGIELDPNFSKNSLVYMYGTFTKSNGGQDNKIFRLKYQNGSLDFDKFLLEGIPAQRNHNGGRIKFGPDGFLYAGTGDAGNHRNSQNKKSLAGKILRMDRDGKAAADNPFATTSSPSYVYIYGVRNSQGFDWIDNETMILIDHGPSGELNGWRGHDEVNIAKKGDNLGWGNIIGCSSRSNMVSPLVSWEKPTPPAGATIYRGSLIPEWTDSLIIGTLGFPPAHSKHLHRVAFSNASGKFKATQNEVYFKGDLNANLSFDELIQGTRDGSVASFGRLREVINGPNGELFVTTSNCDRRNRCPSNFKDVILKIIPKN